MKLPLTLFIAFQVCRLKARLASNVRTARQLRGSSNIFEKQVNSKVLVPSLYRVTIAGTFMTQTDGSIIEEERQVSCIPIVGFKETDELYPIKLPQTILVENHKAIASGQLFLSITNTELIQGEIMMTKDSNVSVILDPRLVSRDVGSSTSGIKSMAIVRISTNDASPQFNATALREGLFSPNKVNLKTQYSACSFGQLVWKLADAGVIEVLVDQPVSDFTSGSDLVTAAQATMKEKMGYATISDLADKVIMCLPPGTGNWVASSGVNFWRAQFNDEWCLSLTATMHETGHMLGLSHSNENGQEYGDSTGYMSFGHMQVDWPRKCFNGFENWQLGWYESRQITVNESSLGAGNLIPLASFVDFTRTDYNESVVVNIADKFYLQYNTAKGFNIGTEEKKNKVTVTAPDKGESENLSGLNETNLYEYPNFQNSSHSLVIEACKKGTNHLGADVMLMSIALDKSLCSSVDAEDWARAYNPLGTPADASPKIPTLDSTSKLNPAVGSFFWLLFTKIYSNKPT